MVPDIDGDGKPLLVGIEKDVKMDNRLVNAIRSAYGLDNPKEWLSNQISAGKSFVVYDEKGADSFLRPYGYSASREEGIKLLDETVPQQQPEVNKKFSMREPVEYTKNLVALHNMNEEKQTSLRSNFTAAGNFTCPKGKLN